MAYRFYSKESEKFEAYDGIYIADENVQKVVNKLTRHFKMKPINVRLFGNRGGHAWLWTREIRLPHNPSIMLIAHEVGHHRVWKHNKKLMAFIKRELAFAEKMQYWNLSITETEHKAIKDREEQKRQEAKGLTVFFTCLHCGYVDEINLSDAYQGHMTWAKEHYKVDNILKNYHCNGCGQTSNMCSVAMERLNRDERKTRQNQFNARYVHPLAISETRDIVPFSRFLHV